MHGKVIKKEDSYFVEYLTEASESDAVEKNQIRLSLIDQHKVREGNEVEFEIRETDTIAVLINR